jgi:hypothetical protein
VFDGPGQITALLAANLMFEFLCALARSKQPGTGGRRRTDAAAGPPPAVGAGVVRPGEA